MATKSKQVAEKRKPTPKSTAEKPLTTNEETVLAADTPPIEATIALKKKEFIDRCVAKSGLKKRDVKPSIEAALAVLGEALEAGEEINLQPFGKVIVKKKKDMENAEIYTCRIRHAKAKQQV